MSELIMKANPSEPILTYISLLFQTNEEGSMLRTSAGATARVDKCKGTFHGEMTERIPRTMIASIINIVSHIYLRCKPNCTLWTYVHVSLYLKVRMKIITIRSTKVHDKLILLLKKKRCNRSASNVARQD
jgi:hypothetical protein